MNHFALFGCVLLAMSPAFAATPDAGYTDLTPNFVAFFDKTAEMEEAARVALFRKEMDPLFPGFYAPRFDPDETKYNARLAKALNEFPSIRPAFERTQEDFAASFKAGLAHFRKVFPGFFANVPVYLVHSIGEMDGGTRTLNGKTYLIFGADVIARIHTPKTITPFLDHELLHVENGKFFDPDCEEVWCGLWTEGLATYTAKTMNPGADDAMLLLTQPKPIRPLVDAKWPAALCFVKSKLNSTNTDDVRLLFNGGPDMGEFPRRFGYYIGLRVLEESGGQYSLPALAHMNKAQAKVVVDASLDSLIAKAGGCR